MKKDLTNKKVGDTISFGYKGNRRVRGVIVAKNATVIQLRLKTDYIGKNEEWFSDETKWFNIKEMKE